MDKNTFNPSLLTSNVIYNDSEIVLNDLNNKNYIQLCLKKKTSQILHNLKLWRVQWTTNSAHWVHPYNVIRVFVVKIPFHSFKNAIAKGK